MRSVDLYDPRITYEQNFVTRHVIAYFNGEEITRIPLDQKDASALIVQIAHDTVDGKDIADYGRELR